GLVQNGFERMETRELIKTSNQLSQTGNLFDSFEDIVISLPVHDDLIVLPDADTMTALPKGLRDKVIISPELGTLTIKGDIARKQIEQLAETFKQPELAKEFRQRLESELATLHTPYEKEQTPSEQGIMAHIPLLSFKQSGFFD